MTVANSLVPFEPHVQAELVRAAELLEKESFAVRLANYAGKPVNRLIDAVPGMNGAMRRIVHDAIMKSLDIAIDSLEEEAHPPSAWLPKAMTGLTGGIGGLFGAASLPFELPLTTTIMLRSIADIARHHGENLADLESRLSCLEVFALGGRNGGAQDDLGYYAARAMFAKLSAEVVAHLVQRGVADASAPVIARLVSSVASRFGIVVSERAAATAIPVLGAVSGATLNVVFMNRFERVAQGHFTLRRLERRHGKEEIQRRFDQVAAQPRFG